MLDLQFLEVSDPLVGHGHVAQVVLVIGQHQPGAVDVEDGVRRADDLAHAVLHVHLAEAQLAELLEGAPYIVHRDRHRREPSRAAKRPLHVYLERISAGSPLTTAAVTYARLDRCPMNIQRRPRPPQQPRRTHRRHRRHCARW